VQILGEIVNTGQTTPRGFRAQDTVYRVGDIESSWESKILLPKNSLRFNLL
jgi:hypothetical protein